MSGKKEKAGVRSQESGVRIEKTTSGARLAFPVFISRRGFTLLELMIVMTIIVVLAAIAMPLYSKHVRVARETVLRDDLHQMRKMIDIYAADKGKLPASLEALVEEGYMREIPVDPVTGEKDWNVTTGSDPASIDGGQGVTNVNSSSGDQSSEGTPYSEW